MENTIAEKKLEDSEILRGLLNKLDISADKFRKKIRIQINRNDGAYFK